MHMSSLLNASSPRTLRFTHPGLPTGVGQPALTPVRLVGDDGLNRLFCYTLDLKSPDSDLPEWGADLDLSGLAGRDACIGLELDGRGRFIAGAVGGAGDARLGAGERSLSGLISEAAYVGPEGRHHRYRLTLRPWLWLATLTADSKIFQDQSVIDILDTVLADYPYPVAKRLNPDTYPKRDTTVQFNETDYAFLARLCEEWGIAWWFEHDAGSHRLILADGPGAHAPNPSAAYHHLDYHPPGHKPDAEYLHALDLVERVTPGASASTDWDYTRPRAELAVTHHDPRPTGQADGEIYRWPIDSAQAQAGAAGLDGAPNDPVAEGELLNRRRLDALRQPGQTARGQGNLRGLCVGHTFTLQHHPRALANIDWLILASHLEIEDIGEESQSGSPHGATPIPGQTWRCHVAVELQAAHLPYRPPPITPKPTARSHRAVVTGPADQELWTDALGRVKVAFPWDRYHRNDERSSAWLRVSSPWAGSHYGGLQLPRIGQEVLVDFENGDPDRPLVSGRVANASQLPPWQLPGNQALSGFRSKELHGHQANHLILDDSAGEIQAQLGSDHALSQLNLGQITRIRDERGRQDKRGQGFELRTDAHGVIRAQDGLLLTTEGRAQAQGHVKSLGETTARLDRAQQHHAQLADLARQHQAHEGQHAAVADAIAQQNQAIHGSGSADPDTGHFPEFAEAQLTLASPAGIAATTAGSLHLTADRQLALTAGQQLGIAADGLFVSVKEAVRLFVYRCGMRLIFGKNDISLEALKGCVKVTAALELNERADTITLKAGESVTINGGGSTTTWNASGITHATDGQFIVHAAGVSYAGPKSLPVAMPEFDAPRDKKTGAFPFSV